MYDTNFLHYRFEHGLKSWNDVIDTAVYKNGMRMLGSRKTETCYACSGTGHNLNVRLNRKL